jgi:hypothetical protein
MATSQVTGLRQRGRLYSNNRSIVVALCVDGMLSASLSTAPSIGDFAMSMPDLVLILATAIVPLVLYLRRDARLRWGLAVVTCVVLAAVLTPRDLSSTLQIAPGLIAVYYLGTRHTTRGTQSQDS